MSPLDLAFYRRDAALLEQAMRTVPPGTMPMLFNGMTALQMGCHMNWLEGVEGLGDAARVPHDPMASNHPIVLASAHGLGFIEALRRLGVHMGESETLAARRLPESQREPWLVRSVAERIREALPVRDDDDHDVPSRKKRL